MKQGPILSILCGTVGFMLLTEAVIAGQVYGSVVGVEGPIRGGVVKIQCGNADPVGRRTDQHGSYSLYVDGAGRCKITVNDSSPLTIRVYRDAVRYDLRVEGRSLQRK